MVVVGAHTIANADPGLVLAQQHEAILEQIRAHERRAGQRLGQGRSGIGISSRAKLTALRSRKATICSSSRGIISVTARPASRMSAWVMLSAEGALRLVEHGEQPEHDEGEQGDGDEDFDESEGVRREA